VNTEFLKEISTSIFGTVQEIVMCYGKSGTGRGVSLSTSTFRCPHHSAVGLGSLMNDRPKCDGRTLERLETAVLHRFGLN
jgi:hypothetical protein